MSGQVTVPNLDAVEVSDSEVVVIQARQRVAVQVVEREVSAIPAESAPGSTGSEPFGSVVERTEVVVVTGGAGSWTGPPGPAGPPGQPGTSSAATISALNQTGQSLRRGCPVYLESDGKIIKANAVNKPHVIGLVFDDSIPNETYGMVQLSGPLDAAIGDWEDATGIIGGLLTGKLYFLSTTAGRITTAPDTSNAVALIGKAISPTRFAIDIEPPIL